MSSLNYDFDEGMLLTNEDAIWVSRDQEYLDELILTNKRLYCLFEKSNGLFKKPSKEIYALSLADIKTVNGQPLIQQVKHEGKHCLQVQFLQGIEYFTFSKMPKKTITQWISGLNRALGTEAVSLRPQPLREGSLFAGVLTEVADNLKNAFDAATETLGTSHSQTGESQFISTDHRAEELHSVRTQGPNISSTSISSFCPNCGRSLERGTRFCPRCGTKVEKDEEAESSSNAQSASGETTDYGGDSPNKGRIPEQAPIQKPANSQRRQEFVGTIFKCPHCGNVVNLTDTVCESCGFHLSGRQAISSAMDFQQKMLRIEMTRKEKKLRFWNQKEFYALDATDKQVLALIQSYPIPNSIEDIVEFFYLALGNINVSKSKKSVFNSDSWDGGNRERTISNAWVGKMKQLYQKAKILFPNEPEFAEIERAYGSMMAELKMQ